MGGVAVGLRQASLLVGMPYEKRLAFVAEGLPIVLQSARGFLSASEDLPAEHHREAQVLSAFAEEEAAKVLILMDIIRCPKNRIATKIGMMTKRFYDHLARMIYAEASRWKPMDVSQLQEYSNHARRTHYVDGYAGEHIFPNDQIYSRESKLYADVLAYEDTVGWHDPSAQTGSTIKIESQAIRTAEALSALGATTPQGVKIVAEIWGAVEFRDTQGYKEQQELTEKMLVRLHERELIPSTATERHVGTLYDGWQLPMYNINLSPIQVSMDELNAEREAAYRSEFGSGEWY